MSNTILTEEQPAATRAPTTEWLALTFALSILLSAFLLFQVQPLISKFILPWFGGSPAVWTTCMLFFQAVLFLGYAYAHVTTVWLSARQQGALHLTLLVAACALSPIVPNDVWKPSVDTAPVGRIFLLLTSCVGLPYFVLSATGPLLQSWYGKTYPGRSPYRLYALSNLGSLVALVSYPFLFEPAFDASTQARLWRAGFAVFGLTCAVAALARYRTGEAAPRHVRQAVEYPTAAPSGLHRGLWLALPACASLMLLATTNHVCQDVAVIPFLWVAPLAIYLISFIVAFDHPRWYSRQLFAVATLGLALVVGCIDVVETLLENVGYEVGFGDQLFVHLALLFCICMLSHGELVRLRPKSGHLTEFYLMISAGGALGGVLVSLLAPALFSTFVEWSLGLILCFVLGLAVTAESFALKWRAPRTATALALAAAGGSFAIFHYQFEFDPDEVAVARNFYGVVGVYDIERDNANERYRSLTHGIVVHGRQYMAPEKSALPLAYYHPASGVGRALTHFQSRPELHVGVVGLGVGTVASYIRAGQSLRFYEINPEVKRFAETYFTYLKDCPGDVDLVMGDARLALESEPAQRFHVLVLDAFSGDAVPTHLLTREAFALYARHLAPDGVLAVNITNHKLDLAPVVEGLAELYDMEHVRITTPSDADHLLYRADWMLLSQDPSVLTAIPHGPQTDVPAAKRLVWTDRYSNLFSILK